MSARDWLLTLAVLLLGCGRQDAANTVAEHPEQTLPAATDQPAGKADPAKRPVQDGKPIYGLPLDIRIDAPKVPESIAIPSPPVKE